MKFKKNILLSTLIMSSISPVLSFAHGALSYPESRQWMCSSGASPNKGTPWNGGDNPACKAVADAGDQAIFTDWSSIAQGAAGGKISKWGEGNTLQAHKNIIGTGPICSGGQSKYDGLNSTSFGWEAQATKINVNDQSKKFTYAVSAPHKTYGDGYVDIYITNDKWHVGQKITFDDLNPTPICHYKSVNGKSPMQTGETSNGEPSRFEDFTCEIPKTTSPGNHVLFAIWQRNDSDEAFYSCSDVDIVNGTPVETSWDSFTNTKGETKLPNYTSSTLNNGDIITFTEKLNGVEHNAKITITNTNIDTWQYTLATQINGISDEIQVGLDTENGTVNPNQNNNYVYIKHGISTGDSDWSMNLETPPSPPPVTDTFENVLASGRDSNMLYDINTLKVGDTLTFRLFNNKKDSYTQLKSGNTDQDSIKLEITAENINDWKYDLASLFNSQATSKDKIEIGYLHEDKINPMHDQDNKNGVYLVKSNKVDGDNYSWTIDVSSPQPAPSPGNYDYEYPNGIESYKSGTTVLGSDGDVYTCKENVAAWCQQTAYNPTGRDGSNAWTSSNTPSGPTTEGTWNSTTTYNGEEKVEIDGITYQALWWNKNKNPKSNHGDWGQPWKIIS